MFTKNWKFTKYRYQKDADGGHHSPLKTVSIKGLSQYQGKVVRLDLFDHSAYLKNPFNKLYLTKRNSHISDKDGTIEWRIIKEKDKISLNFVGILINIGSRKRKEVLSISNSRICLQILDGDTVIHTEMSMVIRDIKSNCSTTLSITNVVYNKSPGLELLTLYFTKPILFYPKELTLSNGTSQISSYQRSESYPCSQVSFNISLFKTDFTSCTLHCSSFGLKSEVNYPRIRQYIKETMSREMIEEKPQNESLTSNSHGIFSNNSIFEEDSIDQDFTTPSQDLSNYEKGSERAEVFLESDINVTEPRAVFDDIHNVVSTSSEVLVNFEPRSKDAFLGSDFCDLPQSELLVDRLSPMFPESQSLSFSFSEENITFEMDNFNYNNDNLFLHNKSPFTAEKREDFSALDNEFEKHYLEVSTQNSVKIIPQN